MDTQSEIQRLKSSGLTYAQIGEKFGFSRQRAQQILADDLKKGGPGECQKCGNYSRCRHRHHPDYATNEVELLCLNCHSKSNCAQILNRKVSTLKKALNGVNFISGEIASKLTGLPVGFCCAHVKDVVERPMSSNQKYPWHLIDFALPNSTLVSIWNIPMERIANFRYRVSKIKPLWVPPRQAAPASSIPMVESQRNTYAEWINGG